MYFDSIELECLSMTGFNRYISNRMEVLAQPFADVLRDPLRSEIIVVQNRSMERWVSMQLALW